MPIRTGLLPGVQLLLAVLTLLYILYKLDYVVSLYLYS